MQYVLHMKKYNYAIIGVTGFYKIAYSDLHKFNDVALIKPHGRTIKGILLRISLKLDKIKFLHAILFPLYHYVIYPNVFKYPFTDQKPICFLFFGRMYLYFQTGYMPYLKKKYPEAKFVLYLQDILERTPLLDICLEKKRFDAIFTYDKGDAFRYKLNYHPTPYSFFYIKENDEISNSDIYFCGKAKNRYAKILEIYKFCTSQGLKCHFRLIGVPEQSRIYSDGLIYDEPIDYEKNLQYVLKTKCILEVMQSGANGFTPRLWESIVYDKFLLTDNVEVFKSEYNSANIHSLDNLREITLWINSKTNYPQYIKEMISPKTLLDDIEKLI